MRVFGGLRGKITRYTLITVTVFMSAFFLAIVLANRQHTMRRFQAQAAQMGELMAVGLKHGMLDGDPKVIQQMMTSLSYQKDIEAVYVLDIKGEVKISSDPSLVGRLFGMQDETCRICHRSKPQPESRSFVLSKKGGRIFRSVILIFNEPECYSCHPSANKLNGMLIADFSMVPFDREVRSNFLTMSIAIVTTMSGLGLVIWLLFNRLIIRRLHTFLENVRRVSAGDLSGHITVTSDDEISELEQSFNLMAESLETSKRNIELARDSLENLINSMDDEIVVIDSELRIVSVNDAALQRLGEEKDKVVGRLCHEVYYNQSKPCTNSERDCPVRETLTTGALCSTCRSFVTENEVQYFEQHVAPMHNAGEEVSQVVKVSRNVTDRRKLEDQLVQSERLIALGQLAAGVAHQVNNPISIIINRIECLKREDVVRSDPQALDSDLSVMLDCAWRASKIARGLLTFSRETPLFLEPMDVNAALRSALQLVQMQTVRKDVVFDDRLQPGLPPISGDRDKLEQCFVNILNNAMDAIAAAGRVTVTSKASSEDGAAVEVVIADTGEGIEPENLGKIFDPFFTTKDVGKGTGLGLSISYGIIRDHGGRIAVSSLPDKGTAFTIVFPVSDE